MTKKVQNQYLLEPGEAVNDEMITLIATQDQAEAYVIKSMLDSNDIECYIEDEFVSATLIYSIAVGGIKIKVKREDLEKAKSIFLENSDLDISGNKEDNHLNDDCPKCGSTNVESKISNSIFLLVSVVFFMIPVLLKRKKYSCLNCSHKWKSKLHFYHFFFSLIIAIFCSLFWYAAIEAFLK